MTHEQLLDGLTAERARTSARLRALDAALAALGMLIDDPTDPPMRHNPGTKPPRGRPAAKQKPAGVRSAPKGHPGQRVTWDLAEAKKLYEAGRAVELIARAVKAANAQSVYYQAAKAGWKRPPGPRVRPTTAAKADVAAKPKKVAARVDSAHRTCAGCHQPSMTNPCHCGHIHERPS